MKMLEFYYEGLSPLDNLTKLAPKDDLLFFDIETTGLSKLKNHIYLIGVGYYTQDGLNIIQWFAENESEEPLVLKEFINFTSSFSNLVNYNGKSFDIPFTKERLNKYGLTMPELSSIDIYTYVKPYKKILSLSDLTQKSIEQFLGISREDKYNGGELISVYKKYSYLATLNTESKEKKTYFDMLILHNKEDVLNMHYLTNIIDYSDIFNANICFKEYCDNEYNDYFGNKKRELILAGLHNCNTIPKSFNTFTNCESGSYIMNFQNDGQLKIRIPITEQELFFYFDNYKDYYYLPSEDMCILKSMAGGISKENRENAKKENCRIKLKDIFIPLPMKTDELRLRKFKPQYKSKCEYIRLSDFINLSDEDKSIYLSAVYRHMFT